MPLLETMNPSSLTRHRKHTCGDSSEFCSICIVQKSNASDLGDRSSYENVPVDHQGRFNNGFNFMKGEIHCPLKGCPCIFQSKGNFLVREGTPRTNKCCFILVFQFNLDLIIPRETIHKQKDFTPYTCINDLIYEWCRVSILRICFI